MSEKSAEVIKNFLKTECLSISEFARLTGLCRFTIYKYLEGGNVHPKAARKIENGLKENLRIFLPAEKLID